MTRLSKFIRLISLALVLISTCVVVAGCSKSEKFIDYRFGFAKVQEKRTFSVTNDSIMRFQWSLKATSGQIALKLSSSDGAVIAEVNGINVEQTKDIALKSGNYVLTVDLVDATEGRVLVTATRL